MADLLSNIWCANLLSIHICFFIFRLFKSILFFVNWISLYFFHFLYYHIILPYYIYYYCIFRTSSCFFLRPSGLLYFMLALLLSILTPLFVPSSSVSLSCFVLSVPMCECLGKHSSMSSPFNIAILNGTFFFPTGNY